MKKVKIMAIAITVLFLFAGCGSDKNQKSMEQEGQNGTPEVTQGEEKNTGTPEMTNQPSGQLMASDYYLSLGAFEESIVVEGNQRDRDEVQLVNGKIVFPEGMVRSLIIKNDTKEEQFVNASKEEMLKFISAVEKADCSTGSVSKSEDGQEMILLYQTKEDEFLSVYIQSMGEDIYFVQVKEDDHDEFAEVEDISDRDSQKDYDAVQLYSKDITAYMDKWMK